MMEFRNRGQGVRRSHWACLSRSIRLDPHSLVRIRSARTRKWNIAVGDKRTEHRAECILLRNNVQKLRCVAQDIYCLLRNVFYIRINGAISRIVEAEKSSGFAILLDDRYGLNHERR
jgi:hypothetical protein